MITFIKGDLFESPAKVLVNTVNTVGVMGKGIAKVFKQAYPEMFYQYQKHCESGALKVGSLWMYKTSHKWILNFPTKQHWKNPSKIEYIEQGLSKFVESYSRHSISSVAFPRLGCGNGELNWEHQVEPLMRKYLGSLPIDIFIYEFPLAATPEHRSTDEMYQWLRGEPKTLAFTEMWSDLVEATKSGTRLRSWTKPEEFFVSLHPEGIVITPDGQGLFQPLAFAELVSKLNSAIPGISRILPKWISPKSIFIPQEFVLDLWQSIRSHGFCAPRIMPGGLDLLSEYMTPIISLLPYMREVELATSNRSQRDPYQRALQLHSPSETGPQIAPIELSPKLA